MTDLTDASILTLRQPWATLWADPALPKTIETRSWATKHRGWVLVHAAKREQQHDSYGQRAMLTSTPLAALSAFTCGHSGPD